MRIVIDSNVIVAAFTTRGMCNELFEMCLVEHSIFLRDEIISEIHKVLINKFKIPLLEVTGIINLLTTSVHKEKPFQIKENICRDPGDLMILGTAEASKADFIVTGDKDLLIMKKYKNIKEK